MSEKFDPEGDFPSLKPSYFESFATDSYPDSILQDLNGYIKPSVYPVAMPAMCIEFAGVLDSRQYTIAKAAYNGAAMLEAAFAMHKYMNKPADEFMGKTQIVMMTLIGNTWDVFVCHAQPGDWDKSTEKYPKSIQYHIHRMHEYKSVTSVEHLKELTHWMRITQGWGRYQAEKMKDDLCKYHSGLKQQEAKNVNKDLEQSAVMDDVTMQDEVLVA